MWLWLTTAPSALCGCRGCLGARVAVVCASSAVDERWPSSRPRPSTQLAAAASEQPSRERQGVSPWLGLPRTCACALVAMRHPLLLDQLMRATPHHDSMPLGMVLLMEPYGPFVMAWRWRRAEREREGQPLAFNFGSSLAQPRAVRAKTWITAISQHITKHITKLC